MQHYPPAHYQYISARDNPLLKALRKTSYDNLGYRKTGLIWLEGDHLCRAYLEAGRIPEKVLCVQGKEHLLETWFAPPAAADKTPLAQTPHYLLSAELMASISNLESTPAVGFVCSLAQEGAAAAPGAGANVAADAAADPATAAPQPGLATVVLDRVQDPGNVGSILRSAAAFGFTQVLALPGTAGLYSGKVLRAGMGAHFSLQLHESCSLADIKALGLPLLLAQAHQGEALHRAKLPWPCAWVFGHEGQGIAASVQALPHHSVHIVQPHGQESLNVAAAAAICLHASAAACSPT